MKEVTFNLHDLICCGDDKILEEKLKVKPHIVEARVDLEKKTIRVAFHGEHITVEAIKDTIKNCGFHCSVQPPILTSSQALKIGEHKLDYQEQKGGD